MFVPKFWESALPFMDLQEAGLPPSVEAYDVETVSLAVDPREIL